MLPPREKGSSPHNTADPYCTQRVDEEFGGEDYGQVCEVCHQREQARVRDIGIYREVGS